MSEQVENVKYLKLSVLNILSILNMETMIHTFSVYILILVKEKFGENNCIFSLMDHMN